MASEKSLSVFPLDLVYWFLSFCSFDLIWVGACVYTFLGPYAQFSMKD